MTLLEYTSPECSTGKHEPCAVVWRAVHAPDDEPYQGVMCSCPCECHRPPMRLVRLTSNYGPWTVSSPPRWIQFRRVMAQAVSWPFPAPACRIAARDGAGTEL